MVEDRSVVQRKFINNYQTFILKINYTFRKSNSTFKFNSRIQSSTQGNSTLPWKISNSALTFWESTEKLPTQMLSYIVEIEFADVNLNRKKFS